MLIQFAKRQIVGKPFCLAEFQIIEVVLKFSFWGLNMRQYTLQLKKQETKELSKCEITGNYEEERQRE